MTTNNMNRKQRGAATFKLNDSERKVVVVIALLWAALLSIVCIWQSTEIYWLADRVNNLEAAGYPSAPSTSDAEKSEQ